MEIKEITSKSALHKLKRKGLPYKYDLNIYRGCTHNCQYCYAVKSHKYISNNNFNEEVFVKRNIAELLDRELLMIILVKKLNLEPVCLFPGLIY